MILALEKDQHIPNRTLNTPNNTKWDETNIEINETG